MHYTPTPQQIDRANRDAEEVAARLGVKYKPNGWCLFECQLPGICQSKRGQRKLSGRFRHYPSTGRYDIFCWRCQQGESWQHTTEAHCQAAGFTPAWLDRDRQHQPKQKQRYQSKKPKRSETATETEIEAVAADVPPPHQPEPKDYPDAAVVWQTAEAITSSDVAMSYLSSRVHHQPLPDDLAGIRWLKPASLSKPVSGGNYPAKSYPDCQPPCADDSHANDCWIKCAGSLITGYHIAGDTSTLPAWYQIQPITIEATKFRNKSKAITQGSPSSHQPAWCVVYDDGTGEGLVVMAEGITTALAEGIRRSAGTIIAAADANNLLRAGEAIAFAYQHRQIVCCVDGDDAGYKVKSELRQKHKHISFTSSPDGLDSADFVPKVEVETETEAEAEAKVDVELLAMMAEGWQRRAESGYTFSTARLPDCYTPAYSTLAATIADVAGCLLMQSARVLPPSSSVADIRDKAIDVFGSTISDYMLGTLADNGVVVKPEALDGTPANSVNAVLDGFCRRDKHNRLRLDCWQNAEAERLAISLAEMKIPTETCAVMAGELSSLLLAEEASTATETEAMVMAGSGASILRAVNGEG